MQAESTDQYFAFCNLEAHNWKVDFAVTHDGPQSIISMYSLGKIRPDETRIFLQEIHESSQLHQRITKSSRIDRFRDAVVNAGAICRADAFLKGVRRQGDHLFC